MNELDQFKRRLDELGEEWHKLAAKVEPDIWPYIPKDTLVEVWNGPRNGSKKRYFYHAAGGRYYCYATGQTSETTSHTATWDNIRLIENDPKPWFGGECPVPDGMRIKVWCRNQVSFTITKIQKHKWNHTGNGDDIIAYQILGMA